MKSKTMFFGAAATAIALSAATISASPAQALGLSGVLKLQGEATLQDYTGIIGQTQDVVFVAPTSVKGTSDFASISAGGITINPLALKLTNQTNLGSGNLSRTFSNLGLTPFINFGSRVIGGVTSNLTFNLFASDDYVGSKTGSGALLSLATSGPLAGNFQFNGATLATGSLSAGRSGEISSDGLYGITLTAQPVPTPALLPGLIGLGMGVLRKRKKEMAAANAEA